MTSRYPIQLFLFLAFLAAAGISFAAPASAQDAPPAAKPGDPPPSIPPPSDPSLAVPPKIAKVIDSFLEYVAKDESLSAEVKAQVAKEAGELKQDPFAADQAIVHGAILIEPRLGKALEDLASENIEGATPALAELAASPNPYIAAEASYYLARARLLEERYADALPLLEKLSGEWAPRSLHSGDALYFQGVILSRMLKRKEAAAALQRFLKESPYAPERMLIGAMQQLSQLESLIEGSLGDVQERMDYVRRKLAQKDSGSGTREEQKRIVDMLAKLIEEAEDRESQGSSSSSSEGQQPKPGSGGGSPGEEASPGEKGGNDQSQGPVVRRTYSGPQSPWSKLRDKQRDPAYSAVKGKFPARYQELIEQYYKSFQEIE